MNINKNLTTINHTALKRKVGDIKYIVVHYVGALGDAKNNTEYYKTAYRGASADFFVGLSGDIWQANDYYNYYSWHCGGGFQSNLQNGGTLYKVCTNRNSIGIELCVKKRSTRTMNATDKDWYFEDATVNAAARLVAYLMKELSIDIDHVVRHFDVNKKICPNPFVYDTGKFSWAGFKRLVQEYVGTTVPDTKEGFIEKVGAIARKVMSETNILASVVTAQCCLETGYGIGSDAAALVKVNNLLGMKVDLINNTWKAFSTWKGKSISKKTPEVYSGKQIMITDSFRVYDDYEQCIRDYEAFLLHVQNAKGYKYACVAGVNDPAAVIRRIRIGTGTVAKPEGYCTDPNYETKILNIIATHNLTRFDTKEDDVELASNAPQKFIDYLNMMNKTMKDDISAKKYWTYKNTKTSEIAKTFEEARKSGKRKVNCVSAVYWGLIGSGVVGKDRKAIQWYGSKGIVWCNKNAEADAKKYFEIIKVPTGKNVKKCISDGTLKPGDIVTYRALSHTNVYLGDGKSFDAGHANCSSSGEGAKFTKWIGATPYIGYQVATILRLKSKTTASKSTTPVPAKKMQYRLQCGVYKVKKNADAQVAKLKKEGFASIIKTIGGQYVVQAGLYSVKANAEAKRKQIVAKKIPCIIKEV